MSHEILEGDLFHLVDLDEALDGFVFLDGGQGQVVEGVDHLVGKLVAVRDESGMGGEFTPGQALDGLLFLEGTGPVCLPGEPGAVDAWMRFHSFQASVKAPHWRACLVPVVTIVSSEIWT